MNFTSTSLAGAFLIGTEPYADERGLFARVFCAKEFAEHGLETVYVQANLSSNIIAGTVRGMNYQRAPHAEVKLVRCLVGAIYDVIVDLRAGSPTYLHWFGSELSPKNGLMMYVPKGFAHGYQALTDGAVVHYMVSNYYTPEKEFGLLYSDPTVGIKWPLEVTKISLKDANLPEL